ncbi:MAG: hypothetical protein FWC16_05685 [Defluviitaleaceae bacterium]|nr:hypothetical protein [Defluviitaleaceae bacterium]MCL2274400.1 hypothetical protein [Defluviitaleaceae bacterium]
MKKSAIFLALIFTLFLAACGATQENNALYGSWRRIDADVPYIQRFYYDGTGMWNGHNSVWHVQGETLTIIYNHTEVSMFMYRAAGNVLTLSYTYPALAGYAMQFQRINN